MSGAANARTRAEGARRRLSLLRELIHGVVDDFVRILARCGLTSEETLGMVREACKRIPRDWAVILRGIRGPDYFHTFGVLTTFLGILEHNLQPRRHGA